MHRRRFIKILATSASAGLCARPVFASGLQAVHWRGYAMGAAGQLTLYTDDRQAAEAVLQKCFQEIQRLEKHFSLYDSGSDLCQLNKTGRLNHPGAEWIELLDVVHAAHRLTHGGFDPSIQSLWDLYAAHFGATPKPQDGPSTASIKAALEKTGWQHVHYDQDRIEFSQPGLQLSLNGVAQGYITDRVTTILKAAGYHHVLVELGETRAIENHPDGRPWRLGIEKAGDRSKLHKIVELENRALATSAASGSRFTDDGRYHHLIDPRTGQPGQQWSSVSVLASTAAEADALSTGLSFASRNEIEHLRTKRSDLEMILQH